MTVSVRYTDRIPVRRGRRTRHGVSGRGPSSAAAAGPGQRTVTVLTQAPSPAFRQDDSDGRSSDRE
eukprot:16948-Hanusia_phi.AAC.1